MGKISQKIAKQTNEEDAVFLDELEEGSVGPIKVMVCRKWDVNNINGRYMSTDFIVSDKKGNVMHCMAKNNIAHFFIDKLHEGALYTLRDFTVQPNREEYRIMKDNTYIIELQGSTIVSKAADTIDGFVRHPFQLIDFEDLKPTDKKYFVDVIGYIAAIGQPRKTSTGAQILDFDLTNQRGRHVRVTFWGTLGDDLLKKKEQKSGVYTVILTCMSTKIYLGNLCLSSSSSTLIIDNEEVPALQDFTSSLSNVNIQETSLPVMQRHEKFETIAELLQWSRNRKHDLALFNNRIEITNVRTKNSWFHFSCTSGKCRKGVSRKAGNFWCDSCETSVPFPRARFRLQLDIQDATSQVVVVLFDETAEKLVKTTAKALLEAQDEDEPNEGTVLPDALQSLIGTTHVFEIKSTTYYQYGDYESFNCSRVIVPEPVKQPLPIDPAIQTSNIEGFSSSSSERLQRISPISTPAKTSEQKKRKIYIEESKTNVQADKDVVEIQCSAKPTKKKRCIVDSGLEADIEDDISENQKVDRSG